MIDNTSLLLQVIGLLSKIAEASGAGGGSGASSVTVLNPSTNYSLETTQQDSLTRLADILTELQGTLQVQELNPITGYSLEITQQDLLIELQNLVSNTTGSLSVTETAPITGFNLEATQKDVLTELQKYKDIETTIFVDTNENPGSSQYIIFRDSIYDTTSATYVDNYYKIDDLGVKIPFDPSLSAGIASINTVIASELNRISQAITVTSGGFVNGSGTIAVANTSQEVFNSFSGRSYLLIQNISDTDMYINFGSPANIGAGSIKLVPNGNYELSTALAGFINTQAINIICSVAGKEFTAKAA